MRAVIVREPGGPEALEVVERPEPEPGPGELLIDVAATAVNRADVLQRQGNYPPPEGASDVLGLELSGTVAGIGTEVRGWRIGDEVCAVVAGGAYAERALVPAATAMPLPPGLSLVEAAAVPEVFATAWDNVVRRGRLANGERLLVHGGSSGVGTAAIQLGVRQGAEVFVTASTEAKLAACRDLGATLGIDYRAEDFVEAVKDATGGRGVDVVLDIIGAKYLESNLRALAVEGRLVIVGLMGGAKAEINLGRLLPRRLTVTGSTLRARGVADKAALASDLVERVWPGFADGSLRPVIDEVLPIEDAARAHERMERSDHIGKLVLTL